jgi:uncharacterized protein (DUF885 family)
MSESEKLTYDIFEWYLQNEVEGEKYKYYNYPVNQFNGIQSELPELLVSTQQVKNKKDAKNYIERLSRFDSKFDGLLEGLKLREEKGIIPPDFILKKVITEMEQFISMEPGKNILVTSLAEKLNKINNLKEKDKMALIGKAANQTEKSVYPAYKKLIEYLYKLQDKATDNAGVWALPDGDAYYAYRLKSYTTTNLTPEQVHSIGLSEVRRIEKEMSETMEKLPVRPDDGVACIAGARHCCSHCLVHVPGISRHCNLCSSYCVQQFTRLLPPVFRAVDSSQSQS